MRLCFRIQLFLVLIITVFFLLACLELGNPSANIFISIDPENTSVERGGQIEFLATVTSSDNNSGTVSWTLSGNNNSLTKITVNSTDQFKSTLFVSPGELQKSLLVTVTSNIDKSRSASAIVIVDSGNKIPPVNTLPAPGELWWNGNTATWGSVTGASSYSIRILKNNIDISGIQTTIIPTFDASTILSSPQGGTGSYTFRVTAIGDGSNLDSPESLPVPNVKYHIKQNVSANGAAVFGANRINGLAFGNGIFIAVGDNSTVMTSSDGNTWTIVGDSNFAPSWDSSARPHLNAIIYGGTRFVIVGQWGHIFYSSNGSSWTRVEGNAGDPFLTWGDRPDLFTITHDGTRFIAAGASIPTGARTANSSDGANWTWEENTSTGNNPIFGISSGNGLIVTVGNSGRLTWSSNGTDWSGGTNGNWISDNIFGSGANVRSVSFGNNTWVIVGDNGLSAYTANPKTESNWTVRGGSDNRFGTSGITNVIFANGYFTAIGHDGKISTSPDGREWTSIPVGTGNAQSGFSNRFGITAAAFGNGKFVFAGIGYDEPYNSRTTYSD